MQHVRNVAKTYAKDKSKYHCKAYRTCASMAMTRCGYFSDRVKLGLLKLQCLIPMRPRITRPFKCAKRSRNGNRLAWLVVSTPLFNPKDFNCRATLALDRPPSMWPQIVSRYPFSIPCFSKRARSCSSCAALMPCFAAGCPGLGGSSKPSAPRGRYMCCTHYHTGLNSILSRRTND